ncbi:hypothetical protein ACT8ZV_08360 [Nocardioides sp. MAHUQ-72]|uniref:hypothetical protein n=1 Tax=unclassified Nocardioides TaxID=2615069 RepID=UPI0036233212
MLDRSASTIDISVETEVDDATAAAYYQLYRQTFGALETRAVARQLLHEHEFLEEMRDPRVHKYVAWNDEREVIGMSTLTADLQTVPWISPAYFAHHYPEHTARRAVYYLGFTLVDRRRRQTRVFRAMVERIVELLVAERAVCAWDICAYNDDLIGLNDNIERILRGCAEVTVAPIDRQTYYAGTFHGPLPTSEA